MAIHSSDHVLSDLLTSDWIAVYTNGYTLRLVECYGEGEAQARAERIESFDLRLAGVYFATNITLCLPDDSIEFDIHARQQFI